MRIINISLKIGMAIIGAIVVCLFLVKDNSKICLGEQQEPKQVSLPVLVKLTALYEREEYFKVWVNEIIAPE